MGKCINCYKKACFNLPGEVHRKYCADHKSQDMIDVIP